MEIEKSTVLAILMCIFVWLSKICLILIPITLITLDGWKIPVALGVIYFILRKVVEWLGWEWLWS